MRWAAILASFAVYPDYLQVGVVCSGAGCEVRVHA